MAHDALDVEKVIEDLKREHGSGYYWVTQKRRNKEILRRLEEIKDERFQKAKKRANQASMCFNYITMIIF